LKLVYKSKVTYLCSVFCQTGTMVFILIVRCWFC